mgnify:FL=1
MYETLSKRLGKKLWEQRQSIESSKKHLEKNRILVAPPPVHPYSIIKYILRATGLIYPARRQFRAPILEHNSFQIPGLPAQLNGFTILHLTDLHIELEHTLSAIIVKGIKDLAYDLCVITGDIQHAYNAADKAINLLKPILMAINRPVYAVPGNHDSTELIAKLEVEGLPFLLNEHIPINHKGMNFHLCGIDDPIYFRTHDVKKARQGLSSKETTLLLSHAATTAEEANAADYTLHLSGHTHGGQLCLPWGIPILKGATPRQRVKGTWNHQRLLGYTSRGIGASHIPARLFCPPEITLHTLLKKS